MTNQTLTDAHVRAVALAGRVLPAVLAHPEMAFAADVARRLYPSDELPAHYFPNEVHAALRFLELSGILISEKVRHPHGHGAHVRRYTPNGSFTLMRKVPTPPSPVVPKVQEPLRDAFEAFWFDATQDVPCHSVVMRRFAFRLWSQRIETVDALCAETEEFIESIKYVGPESMTFLRAFMKYRKIRFKRST